MSSLVKELANEKLLEVALRACSVMLQKELSISKVVLAITEAQIQSMLIKAGAGTGAEVKINYPISYCKLNALAGIRDEGNNFAMRKHGHTLIGTGDRATTTKAYVFPITLGIEFHYIDDDPIRMLNVASAVAILSQTNGLCFTIDVGDHLSYQVRIELPLDTSINIMELDNQQTPGASDMTTNLIVHTHIAFFRRVASVNGDLVTQDIVITTNEDRIVLKQGGS